MTLLAFLNRLRIAFLLESFYPKVDFFLVSELQ